MLVLKQIIDTQLNIHQKYIVYFYRKAPGMQVTVLHLQDDLDAAHVIWLAKDDISKHKIFITPKYGKFNLQDVRNYYNNSDAIILFVFDSSVPLDLKTKKEIQLAIKENKDVYVIAPQNWKLPKLLKNYKKLRLIPMSYESLIEIVQKKRKKTIEKIVLPIMLHALAKRNRYGQA